VCGIRAAEAVLEEQFMLTCKELTELITDYLEGRLSLTQHLRFQFHLGLCRDCRAYLRQMWLTVRTLRRLPEESLSPAMREKLLEQFKDWCGQTTVSEKGSAE